MKIRLIADENAVTVIDGHIGAPSDVADTTIRAGAGAFHPGLINAHDHLHRNHYPRLGSPPYSNAYQWGDDLHTRFVPELARAAALPRATALLFGALKNLLGGATTVIHHDRWEPAFECGFPVRVPRIPTAHSLRLEPRFGSNLRALHLAEGTDLLSADEVREADRASLLREQLVAVHMIGADDDGIARFRRSGAAVAWCPTSNEFLFGCTAPAPLLAPGLDVLIGTDALLTGAGTILDELQSARALGLVSDERLAGGVGSTAARRFGLPAPSLSEGAPADVILLRKPLLEARPQDVRLVLVRGVPQVADVELAGIFEIAGVPCEPLIVASETRLVASPLARAAQEVFALTPECRRIVA